VKKVYVIFSCVSFFVSFFVCAPVCAKLNFANYNAHIVLKENTSKLVVQNSEKIKGWSEFSLVRDFGDALASTWVEGYSSPVTISTGGSSAPTNNLVISNSNAIMANPLLSGFSDAEKADILEKARTYSNAFVYCCKNTSNSLRYGIKNNSNALVYITSGAGDITPIARTTSNAFVYCCKNTSNALVYGIKNNSNTILVLKNILWGSESSKATSAALVYCCKNTSNAFNYGIKIYDEHQVYSGDSTEQNFVYFKNGFTVDAHKTLALNTPVPVTGNINLQDLGIIELQNDLNVSSNAYLTSGGIIDGNGYSLVLSCSFSIPENKQLHIVSDTIINGHGTTLYLEPHARIVVDHGVTLTLKNIRIKNTRNNLSNPIIRPTGHGARVALQDVELALADDFIFRDGQLFIHDDVLVTGSSKFSYRSSRESYICDSATLGFDKNTTFFYYPSTCDNSLIHMQSKTSGMYFDGATLLTTHTGIRLSRGLLCLDNNVTLSSASETLFTSLSSSPIDQVEFVQSVYSATWSPDGQFLAIAALFAAGNYQVRIYRFDGVSLSLLSGAQKDIGSYCRGVEWSPDGKYLAIGGESNVNKEVRVYCFNGTVLIDLLDAQVEVGTTVFSVSWSPDGKYLAIGRSTTSGTNVRVYSFDGTSLSLPVATLSLSQEVRCVDWSKNGTYLAIGIYEDTVQNEVHVYRFTGMSLDYVHSKNVDITIRSVKWSPDGNYLAIGCADLSDELNEIRVYSFNGVTLTQVAQEDVYVGVKSVAWSPDGKYLAVGAWLDATAGKYEVRFYDFDGSSLTDLNVGQIDVSNPVEHVEWSPDGRYFAIGAWNNDLTELRVYRVNYRFDTMAQSFNNGIIFGDSSQLDGDLDVQVLAGARVNIVGKVLDDSSF